MKLGKRLRGDMERADQAVTGYISKAEYEELTELLKAGEYSGSGSQFIRRAIQILLEAHRKGEYPDTNKSIVS